MPGVNLFRPVGPGTAVLDFSMELQRSSIQQPRAPALGFPQNNLPKAEGLAQGDTTGWICRPARKIYQDAYRAILHKACMERMIGSGQTILFKAYSLGSPLSIETQAVGLG